MNIRIIRRYSVIIVISLVIALYIFYGNLSKNNKKSSLVLVRSGDLQINEDKKQATAGVTNKVNKMRNINPETTSKISSQKDLRKPQLYSSMHVALTSCDHSRIKESIVLIKSALIFAKGHLTFHIFTDSDKEEFKKQLSLWEAEYRNRFTYEIHSVSFPSSGKLATDEWKKLFQTCAAQRLFIADLLPQVDSILYVDTDVMFLGPIDEIWTIFRNFTSKQLAALTTEHLSKSIGWYNRFAQHPYYGETGVNSGVILMNLTRVRSSSWLQAIQKYALDYKQNIVWGDQDLINIYFHFYPDQIYVMSCENNYRPDHCMYTSLCKQAEKSGVLLLHGNRRVWFKDSEPAFKAVYTAFDEHTLGHSVQKLLDAIEKNMKNAKPSNCGTLSHIYTRQMEKHKNSTSWH